MLPKHWRAVSASAGRLPPFLYSAGGGKLGGGLINFPPLQERLERQVTLRVGGSNVRGFRYGGFEIRFRLSKSDLVSITVFEPKSQRYNSEGNQRHRTAGRHQYREPSTACNTSIWGKLNCVPSQSQRDSQVVQPPQMVTSLNRSTSQI